MKLFRPTHFPLCHEGGVTRIPLTDFDEIEPGVFRRKGDENQHSLHDSMKTSMRNSLSVLLSNYSNWTYLCQISLSVGNIARVEVPLPSGYVIYSAPLPAAMMGNVEKGEHCFPSLFGTDENTVVSG